MGRMSVQSVVFRNAEQFQRFTLRCSSKGKKRLVLMLALTDNSVDVIIRKIYFRFVNAFFGVILYCNTNINQAAAQCLCRLTTLSLMRFINDDCELSAGESFNIFIRKEELLNCANDDTFFIVDSFCQITGMLLFVNTFKETGNMLKAVNGVLKLAIENDTVSNDDNGIKYTFIIIVVKRCQSICNPSNRIGFSGAGRVFNQIIGAGTFFTTSY